MNKKNVTCFSPSFHQNFVVLAILLFFVSLSLSTQARVRVLHEVSAAESVPWQKIELLEDDNPNFTKEYFHLSSRRTHSTIRRAFKTNQPQSNHVLLHYAPGWNKRTSTPPVLLVHGAGDNASRGFTHPYTFDLPENGKIDKPGIMQHLVKNGFSVFAVTFSHPHGCNFMQAQQLANAIARIKFVTGAKKIDILSHSKGAMPARIYASTLGRYYKQHKWITPYRRDIRRIMFVASPLKGIDTSFRYYMYNYTVRLQNMAAPLGPKSMFWQGMFVDTHNHNNLFPGQFQMLHNWVKDGIKFSSQSATTDMNATRNALYHGGMSAFLTSDGIDRAIHEGGNVIELLNKVGVHSDVQCHILAGSKQDIDKIKFLWLEIPVGEFADSSDGVVFLKSATYTDGLTARGAKIGSVKTLNTHHVGLTVLPAALNHIVEVLGERDSD